MIPGEKLLTIFNWNTRLNLTWRVAISYRVIQLRQCMKLGMYKEKSSNILLYLISNVLNTWNSLILMFRTEKLPHCKKVCIEPRTMGTKYHHKLLIKVEELFNCFLSWPRFLFVDIYSYINSKHKDFVSNSVGIH